ncbi:Hypothetical protein, putative [Bodo saltans]|uniref:Uncharacterized protein n=1 Tax=Bodo saltans TaxID=75058 RepID=A0A0S4ISD5_BODSA|nr:Hypothetical protein, putative [Bodo saltans]|eukprot:CUF50836.1 Hypothetical protein, putative [Bodo saltans]
MTRDVDEESLDGTNGSAASSRVGSSHGVIRGNTVQLSGGGTGRAIGRLGGAAAPSSQSADDATPKTTKSNYFNRVGSVKVNANADGREGLGNIPAPPVSSERPTTASNDAGANSTWAAETYRQRVTLSRQGSRKARGAELRAEMDDDIVAIHDALVPQQHQSDMAQRRMSLQALGQRRESSSKFPQSGGDAAVARVQSMRAKQEALRRGSGLTAVGASDSTTPGAPDSALGENSMSFDAARPGTAPTNPLANRQQASKLNGTRRVGHLSGAKHQPAATAAVEVAPSSEDAEDRGGCLCF